MASKASTNPVYTTRVDILDTTTGIWTTSNLSQARSEFAAGGAGTKVFFAGGHTPLDSDVVDIYDLSTGNWTTSRLSQARMNLSGISLSERVIFAGGSYDAQGFSNVLDIFDVTLNEWISGEM